MTFADLLHNPSPRWRGLRGQKQFIIYMRYSAHILTLIFAILFLSILFNMRELFLMSNVVMYSSVAMVGIVAAVTVWVVETAPVLNREPRPSSLRALAAGTFVLVALAILGVVGYLTLGDEGFSFYVGSIWALICLAWAVAPRLRGRWMIAVFLSFTVYAFSTWVNLGDDYMFMALTFFLFLTMLLTEWAVAVIKELELAKATEAALSANDERLRIAQQLHDSLGQSLAAMNLKIQVIDKLLVRQPQTDPAVASEVDQLKTLVSDTSTHMREVVHDYRKIELAGEFHNAKELLESAGIRVVEVGNLESVGVLSPSAQQVAGWFVREVSTNIMRHSNAENVEFSWQPGLIKVTNDGVASSPGRLSGLDTLQQRARRDGGAISADRTGDQFSTVLNFGDQS